VKYFINVPVNPLYHVIGLIVEWISAKQVRKNLGIKPEEPSPAVR